MSTELELEEVLSPLRQCLKELAMLPQGLATIASTSQFLPTVVRESLQDIAQLSHDSLQQLEQAVETLAPFVTTCKETSQRLEDMVAEYSVQVADTRAENVHLRKLAAVRLITYSFRNAVLNHRARKKEELVYPTGQVTFVATAVQDIQGIRHWNNQVANDALGVMGPLMRRQLKQHRGIEYEYDGDGGFVFAFHTPHEAVRWCCGVQTALQRAMWPSELFGLPACRLETGPDGDILFSGLRVQMGLCTGAAQAKHNVKNGAVEYVTPLIHQAQTMTKLALPGEVLVVDCAYDEIIKKPMTKVPMAGIAWLHRKEYMIVENEAQLLHTALPTELMNRRKIYTKTGCEASPLVSVAGEQWTPLDAPHQRGELAKRQISKVQSGAVFDPLRNVDVLATLKKNSKFMDVVKQLTAASGLMADLKSEDLIAVFGRAIASVRAMQLRIEILKNLACKQIRSQRWQAAEFEAKRQPSTLLGSPTEPLAHADPPSHVAVPTQVKATGDTSDPPVRTSPLRTSPLRVSPLRTSPVRNPSPQERVGSAAAPPTGVLARRLSREPRRIKSDDMSRPTTDPASTRSDQAPKGETPAMDDWCYKALLNFSLTAANPTSKPEDQGAPSPEGPSTDRTTPDTDEDVSDGVELELVISACLENPAQYLMDNAQAVARPGQQTLRFLSRRGSPPRMPPTSLTEILKRVTAAQGSVFGSTVQVANRRRSGSLGKRTTSTVEGKPSAEPRRISVTVGVDARRGSRSASRTSRTPPPAIEIPGARQTTLMPTDLSAGPPPLTRRATSPVGFKAQQDMPDIDGLEAPGAASELRFPVSVPYTTINVPGPADFSAPVHSSPRGLMPHSLFRGPGLSSPINRLLVARQAAASLNNRTPPRSSR